MNDHELAFVEFLAEPSRGRIKTLLELGEKRRPDVRSLLHNAVRLEPRFSRHLTGGDAFSGPVEEMLLNRGAPPTCYVIGGDGDLDGREMPLRDALEAIIGMGSGAFLSSIPGRLGFYEYAGMKSSYLLSK